MSLRYKDQIISLGESSSYINTNLLDNAYWAIKDAIINQRGISGAFNTVGSYFIDRWVLTNGSVEITDGGLKLDGTIEQRFERAFGDNVTASALSTIGFVKAEYDDDGKRFTITANGETIIAAKLELGNRQTLAHQEDGEWILNDPPPNKALELEKCKRYYMNFPSEIRIVGFSNAGGSGIGIIIANSCAMRATPTCYAELAAFYNPADGSTIAVTNATPSVSVSQSNNYLTLNISGIDVIGKNFTSLRLYVVRFVRFTLSADL